MCQVLQKVSATSPYREFTAYGSRLALRLAGTTWEERRLPGGVALQDKLDRSRKAFVLVRGGDMGRLFLDVVCRITHRDRDAAFLEHRQIVLHVADGGDGIGRNALTLGDRLHEGALVAAGRGDIE